ncbi:MAG: YegP family protein [Rubricella sp.]
MAGENDKFEVYQDKKGEWRWRRKASNGQIVGASSEGYKAKGDAEANASRQGYTG